MTGNPPADSITGWRQSLFLEYAPRLGWTLGGRAASVDSGPLRRAVLTTPAEGVRRLTVGRDTRTGDEPARDEDGGLDLGPVTLLAARSSLRETLGTSGRLVVDGEAVGWVLAFELAEGTEVFGGGESYQGPRLRGRRRLLLNDDTLGASGVDSAYLNVPFIWSPDGWGIWLDTGSPVGVDVGALESDVLRLVTLDDTLDLHFFRGSPEEIVAAYTAMTGRPRDFPDPGHGVWMSRASYFTLDGIEAELDELEAADCPVDVVHVDAWQSGNVFRDLACNWDPDDDRFPPGWTARLAERGVGVSLWLNPYVAVGSSLATDLHGRGLLLQRGDGAPALVAGEPPRHLVDFTNPAAVSWWQERIEGLLQLPGVLALKLDFAEEVPFDAVAHDGTASWTFRNRYADTYQHVTMSVAERAGRPIALFGRSGTSGSQRWACHWVGDSPSTWQGLDSALRGALSLSASGFVLVGHDVGGFWTPSAFGRAQRWLDGAPEPFPADVDPELFARWAQWGALSPVMRFHGTGRREPTAYPEPFRSAAVQACRLRRELQPYLRDQFRDAADRGLPLMRPMAMTGADAPLEADTQYLLGSDVLVAPVLAPGGRRTVWVPPGEWSPLFEGMKPVDGPGWHDVECDIHQFPGYRQT